MEDEVIDSHIKLYVNDFSLSLGQEGRKAVETLEEMARCRNIL
jgi:1,4-dihydroxy-6-naphthoate synthase